MSDRFVRIMLALRNKLAPIVPRRVVHGIGVLLGTLCYHLVSSRRRVAVENLKDALNLTDAEAHQLTKKVFVHLGLMIVEVLFTPTISEEYLKRHIDVEGREYLEQAKEMTPNGLILYSAHFGNFELLGGIVSAIGLPLHVISREQDMATAQKLLEGFRHQYGLALYPRGQGWRAAYRGLKRGENLVLLGDQEAGSNGWFVDFFGRKASTFPGVVQIAQRTGAAILPVYMARTGVGRHKVIFQPPVIIEATADQQELLSHLQQLTHSLEEVIRKYPDQWFWIHRRWKTKPNSK